MMKSMRLSRQFVVSLFVVALVMVFGMIWAEEASAVKNTEAPSVAVEKCDVASSSCSSVEQKCADKCCADKACDKAACVAEKKACECKEGQECVCKKDCKCEAKAAKCEMKACKAEAKAECKAEKCEVKVEKKQSDAPCCNAEKKPANKAEKKAVK